MVNKLVNKYKRKGVKITPQRLAIVNFLEGNTTHPTAKDIFRAVKKRYPTISFATVYNTLELLKDKGEILEITIDPNKKHYDPNTAVHHHIRCTGCGKIEDVFRNYSGGLTLPGYLNKGFEIKRVHVDFYGLCKICLEKVSPTKRKTY